MTFTKWTLAIAAAGMAVRYLATRDRSKHSGPKANRLALRMPDLDVRSDDYSPAAATARIANFGRPSQPTGPSAVGVGSDVIGGNTRRSLGSAY